jgi:cryptochrome
VFDRFLLDWDPALNSANWQWLSASAFFHFFYRVYSPATYGQKSDPTGALIRQFCPELNGFSDKYIYTPWLASKKEQEKAGCIIGKDYPEVSSKGRVEARRWLTSTFTIFSASSTKRMRRRRRSSL